MQKQAAGGKKRKRKARRKRREPWLKNALICIMLLLVITVLAMVLLYAPKTDNTTSEERIVSERVKNGMIRVALSVTDFSDIYHTTVQVSGADALTITCGDNIQQLAAGEVWDADAYFSGMPAGESCCITPTGENGISLLSVTRAGGTPVYEGSLEIFCTDAGYVVVNELPVETYLRYVVPSEMPHTYGAEALKAQAVCARNFAWQHMYHPGYPAYDADLDDSIRYQVYNNGGTTAETDEAITATAGEVLLYEGTLADTYYYSTSWGYTTDLSLWGSEGRAYYTSHWQGEGTRSDDLTDETVFARVLAEETDAYESGEAWYRWETTISVARILENLKENVLDADDSADTLTDIVVTARRSGGSVSELFLMIDGKPVVLTAEMDIRNCLLPKSEDLIRNDGSVLHGYEKLPSSFFLLEKQYENGVLIAVTVKGGGCGHGLGMSQNCAKALAAKGMRYDALLDYFYPGTYLQSNAE